MIRPISSQSLPEAHMYLPVANKALVDEQIQLARKKIQSFKSRIELIDRHLEALRHELQAADTTIEYSALSAKRQSLLFDLFLFQNEYGDTQPLPEWHIERLQRHSQSLQVSIRHYERCKQRRLEGISFLKADIERLEIIGNACYRPPVFRLAGI